MVASRKIRLVMELRDRISPLLVPAEQTGAGKTPGRVSEEALLALISLGYPHANAEKAIRQSLAEHGELPVEDLITRALRNL